MIGDALQKAIYAALMASPAVASGAVYDRVPKNAGFPRVTIGDEQVLDDGDSCGDAWEAYSTLHVWSRPNEGSKSEVKILAAEVAARVATEDLAVSGFTVVVAAIEEMRFLRDPDGITEHGVVTVRHELQPD